MLGLKCERVVSVSWTFLLNLCVGILLSQEWFEVMLYSFAFYSLFIFFRGCFHGSLDSFIIFIPMIQWCFVQRKGKEKEIMMDFLCMNLFARKDGK